MLLIQLEAFVATVREGTVSRAADALHITQPTLTARLQGLETELGGRLLVRGRGGARLTPMGRVLLPYAIRTLEVVRESSRAARDALLGAGGHLVVGAAPAINAYVLPRAIAALRREVPSAAITIRSAHTEEVLRMVLREEVQIGITREIADPAIVTTPLFRDEVVVVCRADDPLCGTPTPSMGDLAGSPFIVYEPSSTYHVLTRRVLADVALPPEGLIEVDNVEIAKGLVLAGVGRSIMPRSAVEAEVADGRLAVVRAAGQPEALLPIVAVSRRDVGPPEGLARRLLDLVVSIAASRVGAGAASGAGSPVA